MSDWPNRVAIGDFVADNNTDDDFRVTAKVTGWGAPPIRLSVEDKSQQDGGWDAAPLYSSRVVTLEGVVDQPSHFAAMAVADALTSLSLRTLHELVIDNEAVGPRSSFVRVEVGADPEWLSPECFTYTLQLRAPDPLKYGPATFGATTLAASAGGTGLLYPLSYPLDYGLAPGVTPGALDLPNAGTASYFPRLRIDGAVTNPVVTLVETGAQIRYAGTVAAGQWLDIDCARRRVLLNGVVSMRHKVSFVGAWPTVPVGGGTLSWSADSYGSSHQLSSWAFEGAWT